MYHRSVITPSGIIILTGGIFVDLKNKVSSNAYFLDYKKNTLE